MKFKLLTITLFSLFFATTVFAEKSTPDIDLKKELSPKISDEQVEVRSYKHQDGASITEYKTAGKVWMIKVQPSGNFPAYYLYDDEGNGTFQRRILGNKIPTAPMWIIKRF